MAPSAVHPSPASSIQATDNEDEEEYEYEYASERMSIGNVVEKLQALHTGNNTTKSSALEYLRPLTEKKARISYSVEEWKMCLPKLNAKSVLNVPFL